MLGGRLPVCDIGKCPRCTVVAVAGNEELGVFICKFKYSFNTAVQVCPDPLIFSCSYGIRLQYLTVQLENLNKHVITYFKVPEQRCLPL